MMWRLAALNIRRHVRRTLLIAFAVMMSVMVMLVIESMLAGMRVSFFENLYQGSGHVQLHGAGYSDRVSPTSLRYTIRQPDEILRTLRNRPEVVDARKIITFGGILKKRRKSIPTVGFGITDDPAFFHDVRDGITDGSMPEAKGQLVISRAAADMLGVSPGDTAIVLVEDSAGRPFYRQYPVTGIYKTGARDYDVRHIFLSHSEAQTLLYLPSQTTELRVGLDSPDAAAAFLKDLRPVLDEYELEGRTWREVHGSFAVALEFFDVFMIVIDLMVVIVAATVITNAVLMNVFERISEYGTLRAIGMKKRHQVYMVLSEGFVEGGAGSVAGLIVGVPLLLLAQRHGIHLGDLALSFGLDPVFEFVLTWAMIARSFLAGCLVAVAGSLYAAFTSVRVPLVEMSGGAR